MATTFRQVMNRVLRIVAEDEIDSGVTELADDYHKLVASFVNQVKEEIEDAHNWRALRKSLSVTVTSGTSSATISSANARSRLIRIPQPNVGEVALVFDVTTATTPILVRESDLDEVLYWQSVDPVTQVNDVPVRFAVKIDETDSGIMKFEIYPKVSANRNFTVNMIVPQDYLEDDDLDDGIKIPSRPLIVGSVWYALQERGEELGASSLYTEERYRRALDDAIAIDSAEQGDYELVPV
jgi:hypothetical protein